MAVDGVGGATRMQSVHDTDRTGYRMTQGDMQSAVATRMGMSADQLREQLRGNRTLEHVSKPRSVPKADRAHEADDGPPANVDRDPRWMSPRRLRDEVGREIDAVL